MCDSSLRSLCSEMQEESILQASNPERPRVPTAQAHAVENLCWEEGGAGNFSTPASPNLPCPARLKAPLTATPAGPAAGTCALSHRPWHRHRPSDLRSRRCSSALRSGLGQLRSCLTGKGKFYPSRGSSCSFTGTTSCHKATAGAEHFKCQSYF